MLQWTRKSGVQFCRTLYRTSPHFEGPYPLYSFFFWDPFGTTPHHFYCCWFLRFLVNLLLLGVSPAPNLRYFLSLKLGRMSGPWIWHMLLPSELSYPIVFLIEHTLPLVLDGI